MKATWPFKDLHAKPKKGRYFPVRFSDAIGAAGRWGLNNDDGKRVRVNFQNEEADESKDFVFAAFLPHQLLILRSWPDTIPVFIGRKAIARAFPALAFHQPALRSENRSKFIRWFLLRFAQPGDIKLVERHVFRTQSAYHAGDKFTHAFKSRITRVEDRELPIPSECQTDPALLGDDVGVEG